MKALLNYAKHIEKDFVHPNSSYHSKIQLALSSIATEDYKKAKRLFENAIVQDAGFPAAWLGKAFVDLALVADDQFLKFKLDEYLRRASAHGNKIPLNYRVALHTFIAFKHAIQINGKIIHVEKFLEQKDVAKVKKRIAATTAVVGGLVLSGQNKSTTKKIVGGTMLAGGGASAVKNHNTEEEFARLADEYYDAALDQFYLSAPIMRQCGIFLKETNDLGLKLQMNMAFAHWTKSLLYLFEIELSNLELFLSEVDYEKAEQVQQFAGKPHLLPDIKEFLEFVGIAGLGNHELVKSLRHFVEVDCPNILGSAQAKASVLEAKRRQQKGLKVGATIFGIGFISCYFLEEDSNNVWIPMMVDGIGIWIGQRMMRNAQSNEMHEFKNCILKLLRTISQTELDPKEIDINQVNNGKGLERNNLLLAN